MAEEKNTIFEVSFRDWARVFRYPEPRFVSEIIPRLKAELSRNHPEALELFRPFAEFVETVSFSKWEEVYIRAFDVQSLTTLDMGYHLFGDDYKRGEFLAHISEECQAYGIEVGSELPDNLSILLELIAVHQDREGVGELVRNLLGPALRLCIEEFEKTDEKKKLYRKEHKTFLEIASAEWKVYGYPLKALERVLLDLFGPFARLEIPETSSRFLCSVAQEYKTEGACYGCV